MVCFLDDRMFCGVRKFEAVSSEETSFDVVCGWHVLFLVNWVGGYGDGKRDELPLSGEVGYSLLYG